MVPRKLFVQSPLVLVRPGMGPGAQRSRRDLGEMKIPILGPRIAMIVQVCTALVIKLWATVQCSTLPGVFEK